MSACAGSSTDAPRSHGSGCRQARLALARKKGAILDCCRRQEKHFESISPAWSRWIAPGRIGFMSTQRWEDHSRLAQCKERAGWLEKRSATSPARVLPAIASGQTAPPVRFPAWAATESLQLDRVSQQPVRLVLLDMRPGSPPPGQTASRRPVRGGRLGYPPIPHPATTARFHLTLPRVPAAFRCRTERYDGKRDMHFQHAS